MKIGGMQEAKVHSITTTKAFCAAPPISSACSGSRNASVAKGGPR